MPITAFPFRVDGDDDSADDYNMHSVAINALEAIAGSSPLSTVYNIKNQGVTGVDYATDSATYTRTLALLPASGGRIVFPEGDYYITSINITVERVILELEPGALIHTVNSVLIANHGSGIVGPYVYSDGSLLDNMQNISFEGTPVVATPIIQVCPLGTGKRLYSVQLRGLNCTGNGNVHVEGVWLGTMDPSVENSPFATGMSFSAIRDVSVWGVDNGWVLGHYIQINDFYRVGASGNAIVNSVGINICGAAPNSLYFYDPIVNSWYLGTVVGNETAQYKPNSIHFLSPDYEGNDTGFLLNQGTALSVKDGYHEAKSHIIRIGTPAGAAVPHGVEISGNYMLHFDATDLVPFYGWAWDGLNIHDNVWVSEKVGGSVTYFDNNAGTLRQGGIWNNNTFVDLGGTTLTVLDALTGFAQIADKTTFQALKLRALGDGTNSGDISVANATNTDSLHLIYSGGVFTVVDSTGAVAPLAAKRIRAMGDGANAGSLAANNFDNSLGLRWQYNGGTMLLLDNSDVVAPVAVSAVTLPNGQLFTTYAGSPNTHVTAPIGSLCTDDTNGDLYRKTSGTGNTGWVTP